MTEAFICDAVRTPFGRFGGALAPVRTDDLAAVPITALMARNPDVAWEKVDAGLPDAVPGATVNRLCGSGLEALTCAGRAIRTGEIDLAIAGGVESMSRAPFVMPKADTAFSRKAEIYDTTIGWRFVNKKMKEMHGVDAMGETAENVAEEFQIARDDQDAFALRSQNRTAAAQDRGDLTHEIVLVTIPRRKGDPISVETDEHPRRETTAEALAKLKPAFREGGSVTAGNASGVNDGACAMLIASSAAVDKYGLNPFARVAGTATAGVPPRIMGIGPAPASSKLMEKLGLKVSDMDVIELNEAFAAQGLAVLRQLGVPDDAEHVNPNGGAIALGHQLGASGARLATTAAYQLGRTGGRYALVMMCIGVGQGIATVLERVS